MRGDGRVRGTSWELDAGVPRLPCRWALAALGPVLVVLGVVRTWLKDRGPGTSFVSWELFSEQVVRAAIVIRRISCMSVVGYVR